MKTISVIIPAYNAAPYIEAVLDKLVTLEEVEIIVVDDGSTDNTVELLKNKYQDKINLIQQNQKGPATARNTGVELATTDYITFIDADDNINLPIFKEIITGHTKDYDFISFGETAQSYEVNTNETREKLALGMLKNQLDIGFGAAVWSKIFSKKFLEAHHLSLPVYLVLGEDKVFNLQCIMESTNIAVINTPFYEYKIHPTSISHGYDTTTLKRFTDLNNHISKYLMKYNLSNRMQEVEVINWVNFSLLALKYPDGKDEVIHARKTILSHYGYTEILNSNVPTKIKLISFLLLNKWYLLIKFLSNN